MAIAHPFLIPEQIIWGLQTGSSSTENTFSRKYRTVATQNYQPNYP